MNIEVPFVDLGRQFAEHEDAYCNIFRKVGLSGSYVMGPSLETFEKKAAEFCETEYALGVANGTDALILAMRALGIGKGDEVITAPNSFIASAGGITSLGAVPVFADIQQDLNIDPEKIRASITGKTKAIVPVHLTGRPAEMDKINEIAKEYSLFVIEDAAQAIGARYKNRRVGSLGDVAAFSLHPLKNLNVMGDGGLVTTNNVEVYEKIKRDRNHGLIDRDNCLEWGLNSRLDALQAELANYKLNYIEKWNERFREIAAKYREALKDIVEVPCDKSHEYAVYHNFVIYSEERDSLMAFLLDKGIETKIHYPVLLHLQPAAKNLDCKKGDFPVAEKLSTMMMSLPIYPEITQREIDLVIAGVCSYFQ